VPHPSVLRVQVLTLLFSCSSHLCGNRAPRLRNRSTRANVLHKRLLLPWFSASPDRAGACGDSHLPVPRLPLLELAIRLTLSPSITSKD